MGQAGVERLSRKDIRAAWPCVGDLIAVAKIWRKWQTAAPIGGIGNLPTADQEVGGAADVGHVFFAASNWQFVHGAKDEYVVLAKIIGTVCDSMINGIVAAPTPRAVVTVVVGVREGVVSEELQTGGETL